MGLKFMGLMVGTNLRNLLICVGIIIFLKLLECEQMESGLCVLKIVLNNMS